MRRRQFLLLSASFAASLPRGVAAVPDGMTAEFKVLEPSIRDSKQGWESLFNGKDISQWTALKDSNRAPKPFDWEVPRLVRLDPDDAKMLARKPFDPAGGAVPAFVNNRAGKSDNPVTKKNYADVELYLKSMVAQGSNSGICLMGLYEIQIYDSYGHTALKYGDNGGIYARAINNKRVEGEPPRVNASRPAGEWESFHIWFRAPRFKDGRKVENARFLRVDHNGKQIHGEYELTGSTRGASPWEEKPEAPLLLQGDHGPVAFRNVYLRDLRTTG
ncbi:MAG: DUF1080 domain-containing protein [Acidobacteria bacterium]|nr:DUF1080 domain-containing protein [Acidobacteriota bacterium]